MSKAVSERSVVFLIGAVQFINVLDFMMVMPLGPYFADALDISRSHLGYVGGAYTAAAAAAGIAGSFFLERFDRRSALAVSIIGLVLGTIAGGFAWNLESLLAARILAGMFGGPATSLSFSIVADLIPPERRGRAMGAVMGAFSVSSVLGVPIGLELARLGGWQLPFFVVGGLGLLIAGASVALLPPVRAHLDRPAAHLEERTRLLRPEVLLSYAMTAVTMAAGFLVIPNLPSYILGNLDFPQRFYGLLYAAGGAVSFFAMRAAGRAVDRFGSFRVVLIGTFALITVLVFGVVRYVPGIPVVVFFIAFMLAMSFRNVAYNTLTSKVPRANERARFMSVQSAVQHFASATGAFLSARMLGERADGGLVGMDRVGLISIVFTAALPALVYAVERNVRLRPAQPVAIEPQSGLTGARPGVAPAEQSR